MTLATLSRRYWGVILRETLLGGMQRGSELRPCSTKPVPTARGARTSSRPTRPAAPWAHRGTAGRARAALPVERRYGRGRGAARSRAIVGDPELGSAAVSDTARMVSLLGRLPLVMQASRAAGTTSRTGTVANSGAPPCCTRPTTTCQPDACRQAASCKPSAAAPIASSSHISLVCPARARRQMYCR